MEMENQQTASTPNPEHGHDAEPKNTGSSSASGAPNTRRRFLTGAGALATAPVIMSLTGRSAFATNGGNVCTPSAYASVMADVTRSGTRVETCNGKSPLYWKNNLNGAWKNRRFSDFFGVWQGSPSWVGDERFKDVLRMDSVEDHHDLGKYLVAAYLSAEGWDGAQYAMTTTQVQAMGQQTTATQQFVVSGHAPWDVTTVVSFIKQTL